MDLRTLIRDIPDYPKEGILFFDITPLLGDPAGFRQAIDLLAERFADSGATKIVAAEARGFIFGAALAYKMGLGFVPVRKPGKLPGAVIEQRYALEYGEDALQVQADALRPGTRVLLVDDVLATGGTLLAARSLMRRQGAEVVGAAVLFEMLALGGRAHWDEAVPLLAAAAY